MLTKHVLAATRFQVQQLARINFSVCDVIALQTHKIICRFESNFFSLYSARILLIQLKFVRCAKL